MPPWKETHLFKRITQNSYVGVNYKKRKDLNITRAAD